MNLFSIAIQYQQKKLESIGFKYKQCKITGKYVWGKGEKTVDVCGTLYEDFVVSYDIENKICKSVISEFCVITKKCETIEEINEFSRSINFLFGPFKELVD